MYLADTKEKRIDLPWIFAKLPSQEHTVLSQPLMLV